MGNTSSSSTTTDHESKFEEKQGLSDADKERFVKELNESLDKQNEKLEKITHMIKADSAKRKDGVVSSDSWLEAMETLVKCTQDANTELLKQLEKPIQQSEEAYTHFRDLVETSSALKKHRKLVQGAMKVYQEYWDLLTKTSSTLTKIMVQVDRVVESIEDYQMEKQLSENNIASPQSIEACIRHLNTWIKEAQAIKDLAEDWNKLATQAESQHLAWKAIETKSKKKWYKIIGGIGCLLSIAAICGALCVVAGPVGIITLCAATMTWLHIAPVAAVGIIGISLCSGGVYDTYKEYKTAKMARNASEQVSKKIDYITDTMSDIAESARKIELILNELHAIYTNVDSTTKDLEAKSKEIASDKVSLTRKQVLMARIDKCFMGDPKKESQGILKCMINFNEQCKKCCQTIRKSKEAIVNKHEEYNKNRHTQ